VKFLGQGFWGRGGLAAGLGFGAGTPARLADAGGDLGFARFLHAA
jgi:hypothetical protein